MAATRRKLVGQRMDVLRQGDAPKVAHVLLDGHAYRYRLLSNGRRQITAILVPGDVCDLEAVMRGRADYGIAALTECVLGEIPAERIGDPTKLDPETNRALWRCVLRDEAIAREWLVNMGRRDGLEKVAHLLCELRFRLDAVGLARAEELDLKLTQTEMADVLGLSSVHVNRVLKQLRRVEMIKISGGVVTMLNRAALEKMAGFDPSYLQPVSMISSG